MKSFIGYILAGLGLIGMALSSTVGNKIFPAVSGIGRNFILIPSLILVGLGVVILIIGGKSLGKIRQSEKEVPIYQGEGKKRKIVGYRVED